MKKKFLRKYFFKFLHFLKKTHPRNNDLSIKILILGILLLLLLGLTQLSNFKNPNFLFNLKWNMLIQINGPEKAYAKFASDNNSNSTYIQHLNAHLFGLLLFNNFGIESIGYCNDAFGYGCYHNLIGAAIRDQGISSVEKLAEKCRTLSGNTAVKSCQHGIGHGLIGYFGYGITGIQQSTEICNRVKHLISSNDCGSGIFMEYNFQDMSSDPGKWRKFDSGEPYNPCASVEVEFQPICIFQQSSWWLKTIPGDDQNKLIQIDSYCNKLQSGKKTECFKGLSYYLGSYFEWNTQQVLKACYTLSSKADQTNCIIQSADIFANGHQLREKGLQLCQSLDLDSMPVCKQKIGI